MIHPLAICYIAIGNHHFEEANHLGESLEYQSFKIAM